MSAILNRISWIRCVQNVGISQVLLLIKHFVVVISGTRLSGTAVYKIDTASMAISTPLWVCVRVPSVSSTKKNMGVFVPAPTCITIRSLTNVSVMLTHTSSTMFVPNAGIMLNQLRTSQVVAVSLGLLQIVCAIHA